MPTTRQSNPGRQGDVELVQRCREGRQDAWDTLIDRYGRLVYSIPRRYGLPDADADDVFQAVFATLFQQLDRLRDDTRLSSWLITTTHRECWRIGKKAGRDAELDAAIRDLGEPDAADAATWERQHLVRLALERLGGRCRDLLTALFQPDPPDYETIASRLDMAVGSIGPTRARCFARLESILKEMGMWEGPP